MVVPILLCGLMGPGLMDLTRRRSSTNFFSYREESWSMTDYEPGYSLGMKQNTTFLHFQNESDTFCTNKLTMDCVGEMEK